jgi:glycosyltransferase involved in cell wall biosynthesis
MTTISVIIPVRDEAEGIERLLDDLLRQRRAAKEIVVVDTGSTDDTRERVAAVALRDSRVRLFEAPGALPGGGRNVGLRAATGEWVAFVDGGMRVGDDWLAALMRPVDERADVDVVLGGLESALETRWGRAAALAFLPARRPVPPSSSGEWRGFVLPSSAVRAELARDVRFPESLRSGEDLVFFRRVAARARIAYAPDAVVHWRHAGTLPSVYRRFRLYAEHSFRGGLMDDWFRPMSRRWLALAATGPALVPSTMAFLLLRAFVMQRRKPELVDASLAGRARQLLETALMLGVIDAATLAAWAAWRAHGKPTVTGDGEDAATMNAGAAGGDQPSAPSARKRWRAATP